MSEEPTNSSTKICGLCNKTASKYCCPRCEVLYCSLDCYKSENHLECSENFYRECVTEELSSNHADDESKRKMIEILKRMQEQDEGIPDLENIENEDVDSDDENENDLHERIKDLNLDDADAVWKALTADERNEFQALLNQGDMSSIIPQWEPWWMYRKKEKLVEDVGSETDDDALAKCPPLKTVPKLKTLTSVQPSPAVKNNIANVLASYVFLMRYFNGDVEPVEWTLCLFNICANLDKDTNFDEIPLAVESVAQRCLQSSIIETDKASLDIMKHDTFLVLQGPSEGSKLYYCKSALSNVHKILNDAKISYNQSVIESKKEKDEFSVMFPEHTVEHLPDLDVNKVKRCVKKLEYYLSYLETHGMGY